MNLAIRTICSASENALVCVAWHRAPLFSVPLANITMPSTRMLSKKQSIVREHLLN